MTRLLALGLAFLVSGSAAAARPTSWPPGYLRNPLALTSFSPDGRLVVSGGIWSRAAAISERGLVVGSAATAAGQSHATLWRPALHAAAEGNAGLPSASRSAAATDAAERGGR